MKKSFRDEFIRKLDSASVLYDKDILNFILSNAYGGRDMSAVADKLLARFPGVKAILSANLEEISIVDGVSENVAVYLKCLGMIEKLCGVKKPDFISDGRDFLQKLAPRFDGCDNERLEFYFVNKKGKVVLNKSFSSDSADKVEMNTDEIVSAITRLQPYGLYCAHNHVNCSSRPSLADDETTKRIADICAVCKVRFLDHCIINSQGEIYSYAQSGKLKG